jgi:hypothetical protein
MSSVCERGWYTRFFTHRSAMQTVSALGPASRGAVRSNYTKRRMWMFIRMPTAQKLVSSEEPP